MNILKIFRSKYISISMAVVFLFVSCKKDDLSIIENTFNYAVYEQYKKSPVFDKIIEKINSKKYQSKSLSSREINRELLEIVNNELGSDLYLSNEVLELANHSGDEILNKANEKGWITDSDVVLVNNFSIDYNEENLETAITNFEQSVINMNLSKFEFEEKNSMANVLKLSFDDESKNLAKTSFLAKGGWDCFFAVVALILTIISLVACATIFLCGVAIAGFTLALRNASKQC